MAAEEQVFYSTGRRKTSSARIFLKPGTGKITINSKAADEYMYAPSPRITVLQAFALTSTKGKYDVYATVKGGGIKGQAEAIRHGIARALTIADETLREPLKKAGYLTRDPRKVERKKYGLHKARKAVQFSKR